MRSFRALPGEEQMMLVLVLGAAAIVVGRNSVPLPAVGEAGPILFWFAVTLAASLVATKLPGGVRATLNTAPLIAAVFDTNLPNPFAISWIAFLGTFQLRDIRGEVLWYGTLHNRANAILSTFGAWLAATLVAPVFPDAEPPRALVQLVAAGSMFFLINNFLSVLAASIRTKAPFRKVWTVSVRQVAAGLLGQVPIGWLMARMAVAIGYWVTIPFLIPLVLARYAFTKYTETRELFYGSVSALSQAIDAKDGFTRGHADRVSRIAGAVAREMGLNERDIEQIELAGLLHDIGKIGVDDRILMKPSRLEPDEQELMRRHPMYGASILEPSAALRPLVPMVLSHHENYDGSGYPEGRKGEEIPLGSRIIIVADAYEAMTSDRIYRKAPGHDRAMDQLNKYKGIQFDPKVVRAIEQLLAKRGPEAFEVSDLPPINYETLDQLRQRLQHAPVRHDRHAG